MAFSEGVRRGGLNEQKDIQVLLCYLLYSVDQPFPEQMLSECILSNEIANHFEVSGALELLIKRGHIIDDDGVLTVSDNGREIARVLGGNLPLTIRERALQTAVRMIARARNAAQTKVDITPLEKGVSVTCAVDTTDRPMMSFTLLVADTQQAELVKARFLDNPSLVYRTLVELMMDPHLKKTDDMVYIPLR